MICIFWAQKMYYGWLEDFNPDWTPNTTDSGRKRYKFGNQAQIGGWNYARLLESMAPLLEQPNKLHKVLDYYYETYQNYNNETSSIIPQNNYDIIYLFHIWLKYQTQILFGNIYLSNRRLPV